MLKKSLSEIIQLPRFAGLRNKYHYGRFPDNGNQITVKWHLEEVVKDTAQLVSTITKCLSTNKIRTRGLSDVYSLLNDKVVITGERLSKTRDIFRQIMLFKAEKILVRNIWQISIICSINFQRVSAVAISLSNWWHFFDSPPSCPKIPTTVFTFDLILVRSFRFPYGILHFFSSLVTVGEHSDVFTGNVTFHTEGYVRRHSLYNFILVRAWAIEDAPTVHSKHACRLAMLFSVQHFTV